MLEVESTLTLSASDNLKKLQEKDDQIEYLLIIQIQLESENKSLKDQSRFVNPGTNYGRDNLSE